MRIERRPGSARSAAYGSALAGTTSRARWKIVFASILPRERLSLSRNDDSTSTARPVTAMTDRPTMAVTPAICLARIPNRMARLALQPGPARPRQWFETTSSWSDLLPRPRSLFSLL